jgi:hypothetical protein
MLNSGKSVEMTATKKIDFFCNLFLRTLNKNYATICDGGDKTKY